MKKISSEILFCGDDFGRLYAACRELYCLFSGLTGIGDSFDAAREDEHQTVLANGKAISPLDAARCVLDIARTTRFLRGIYAALRELKKRFPTERIEILYAGCGPFATLIVPLLDHFTPDEINLTLLDYHRRSIESARSVFRKLQFENFAARFVQADASRYRHDGEKPHLIIAETMQKTLEKEPQAALTLNLAPQLAAGGFFVPQKISIEACLADSSREHGFDEKPKRRIHLGTILELDAEKIRQNPPPEFSKVTLEIPPHAAENSSFLLLTKIVVFDSHALDDYDSAITYPTVLRDLGGCGAGSRVEFIYVADESPRFHYRLF